MRIRVKICGLMREEDVISSVEAGVDALGFVFYKKSPRYISPERAKELVKMLPGWICSVGLFVNQDISEIEDIINFVGLSHVQLHGNEADSLCRRIKRPVIKAIRLPQEGAIIEAKYVNEVKNQVKKYQSCCTAVLMDSQSKGFGGSGRPFKWDILDSLLPELNGRWILSGGLNLDNIRQAIDRFQPLCIDVSSGVELIVEDKKVPGVKDTDKINKLICCLT